MMNDFDFAIFESESSGLKKKKKKKIISPGERDEGNRKPID